MVTRSFSDRFHFLGNEAVRLCLVRGDDRSALVEVGITAAVPEVISQLDGLGVSPDFLVVTHPHADHMTGLPGLKARFPAAQVVAAAGAAAFARHPKMAAATVREDAFMAARLVERGLAGDAIRLEGPMSLDVDCEVADSETVDLGGLSLVFHHVRGHCPGNLIACVPEADVVIASDALGLPYGRGRFFPFYLEGYRDYLDTMEGLSERNARVLVLGHGDAYADDEVTTAIERAREDTETFHGIIIKGFAEGVPEDALARRLLDIHYRDELRFYSPENITTCCRIMIKRSAAESRAATLPE